VSTTSATKTAQVVEPVEVGGNDKLLKSLYKKLKQIEVLKEKQAQGATLEVNQLEKLSREKEIREEIAEIEEVQRQFSLT
jgi:uncharacterized protein with WD repeat